MVKDCNRNNSAADCSIAFKFGKRFDDATDDTLQMFKFKGQKSRSRRKRKVMYHQQKPYNTAMYRFSDVKLGMASLLKRKRTGVWLGRPSCNAFAIATFSSYYVFLRT